ncbi:transcription elongation factor A protein 2 isoform X2 [Erinaceus europaeus]|uniref:Transcription elongation factor n=1 Tax=Erinaceus europaeus TaxID=9365 RepID=A0ABM3VTI3_ERIEU|nr:transcription elongation factor A protein 2 isoform X2 [Erinaceus europaeus]
MMGKEEEIARIARRLDKMVTKKSAVRGAGLRDPGTPAPPSPAGRPPEAAGPARPARDSRGAGRPRRCRDPCPGRPRCPPHPRQRPGPGATALDSDPNRQLPPPCTPRPPPPPGFQTQEGAMDLLRELKAMPVTLHLLQSTRVGMSVNALRKQSSDEEVITLAKSLIKSWKKLLDASDAKARERRRGGPLPTSSKETPDIKDPSRKRPEPPRVPPTPRITTFPPVPVTCDAVRTKCREMLTAALQTDDDHVAASADCGHLSAQIEECIFRDVGNTDMKYKNRVRSRISNLKDAKNPGLRRNVLCGAITPQQIAVMTSEEMASDELKEIRKAMTKEAIREHQMARTGGTQTDLFTCGKCRKKNCTYTQVQTRSSDEPMTTFVVCNECGNRWKFC